MKKTNKITMLMLTGILSLGLINNVACAAAARTPVDELLDAARNGNMEAIRTLLEARVDVNAADKFGQTALMLAASQGHNNVVAQLIQARANVNATNSNDDTALMYAVDLSHINVVTQLIQANANVDATNKSSMTALMGATRKGYNNLVAQLIGARADVDAAYKNGTTALICATENGYNNVVAQLIGARANIDVANDDGMTALKGAVRNGHNDIVQSLIYGLLTRQMRQTQKQMGYLGTYNSTCGNIGEHCGALTQLPADSLNRVLWYLGAQECQVLRQTCRGLSLLQPDNIGLPAMARQATCRNFLQNYAQCDENMTQGETTYLWQYLMKFLKDECQSPVCNIATWEASIKCAIKKRCAIKNEIEEEPLSDEHVHALEKLIHIVKEYYQESIALVKAPAAAPSATELCADSMLTVCPDLQDVAGRAPSLMAQAIAVAQPDAQRDEEELRQAIALSLE